MDSTNALFSGIASWMNFPFFYLGDQPVTLWVIVQLVVLSWLVVRFAPVANSWVLRRVWSRLRVTRDHQRLLVRCTRFCLIALGVMVVLRIVGLHTWVWSQLVALYTFIEAFLHLRLFQLGRTPVTLWTVAYVSILAWLLVRVTTQLHHKFVHRLLARTKMDLGARQAMGAIFRYGLLFLGFVVLLQTAGIDLSALTIIISALGIGISFGLQTIVNNFISGLILLFERPIKVGDRVQVGNATGEVVDISLRATTILTNEHVALIVPNSQFITSNIVNWTAPDSKIALNIHVSVPAKSDPEKVQQLLLDTVSKHSGVLREPAPSVLFEELSPKVMRFSVCVWTKEYLSDPDKLRSDINFAISKKVHDQEVEVRFLPGGSPVVDIPAQTPAT